MDFGPHLKPNERSTMRTPARIKLLAGIAVTLALAASLLVATKAGAQDRSKPPKEPPPTSYMPVIEEPFEVVRARDKANKPRVMAAAMRLLESRYDLTRRVDPDVKMTHGKAIPVGPTARHSQQLLRSVQWHSQSKTTRWTAFVSDSVSATTIQRDC